MANRVSTLPRRAVLQSGLGVLAATFARSLPACSTSEAAPAASGSSAGEEFAFAPVTRPSLVSRMGSIGPLAAADADGLRLPPGFTARIVAKSGSPAVAGSAYAWHGAPDGGATFPLADGGWVYVSNSELPFSGGVGALRFDRAGAVVDTYPILQGTNLNCAGGATPWGTWLSCEEVANGKVFECDPSGVIAAVARPALGVFKHEAVAVDPLAHRVYLTEDEPDGCFYRYVPDRLSKSGFANLAAGRLEVASVDGAGKVTWHPVADPELGGDVPTRKQVTVATPFKGGEGIWWHAGVVYFSTKGDDRVWAYDAAAESLAVLYDGRASKGILTGVDNLTVSCCGDVLVAEDGGDMELVVIFPSGELRPIFQIVGQGGSELTGPAFDPSGTRLYVSSQRGGRGGLTYEISGPFHAPA